MFESKTVHLWAFHGFNSPADVATVSRGLQQAPDTVLIMVAKAYLHPLAVTLSIPAEYFKLILKLQDRDQS